MDKKIALITGASRGLGKALAIELCGVYHIVAVARTIGALEELDDKIRAIGGSATLAPTDISDRESVAQLCRSIFERWGKIDLWAHTAVYAPPLAPVYGLDNRDWEKSIHTNVISTGILIPFLAPLMVEKSIALFFKDEKSGKKFFSAYGISKIAQIALAENWALETSNVGPKIYILSPRPMKTATRKKFFPGEPQAKLFNPQDEAKRLISKIQIN